MDNAMDPIRFDPDELRQLGTERYVMVYQTFKDDTYAAELKLLRVKGIVENFKWTLFFRPLVSERKPGKYAVLDGNHRIAAVRRKFGPNTPIPVVVLTGLSLPEEAAIFTGLTAGRRVMGAEEVYKGRIVAEEPDALSMQAVLDARNIKIGNKKTISSSRSRVIRAVSTAMSIHKTGNLAETLDVLLEAWPDDPSRFAAPALVAVSNFLLRYPDAEKKRLIQVMERQSFHKLDEAIEAGKNFTGNKRKAFLGRAVLLGWYNERLTNPNRRLRP